MIQSKIFSKKKSFHEKLKPQKLHRQLCALYGSVTSQSTSNLQQFVDCIHDLAQPLAHSLQLTDGDFKNVDQTNHVTDLVSKYLNGCVTSTDISSVTAEITATAAKINLTSAISRIADSLDDKMSTFITNLHDFSYFIDDGPMLGATFKVLTSVCCDTIRSMVQSRTYRLLMRARTMRSLSNASLSNAETDFKTRSKFKYSDIVSRYSSRVRDDSINMRSTTETNARLITESYKRNIIILDADKEVIVTFASPKIYRTIQLIYNPPCREFPGGHYDVYKDGKVVQVTRKKIIYEFQDEDEEEDDDLLFSAFATVLYDPSLNASFIDVKEYIRSENIEHPRRFVKLFASDHYAGHLKHGRVLLRLNMNHSTTHIDQLEHEQLESSHLLSCIKQALKSDSVSQLASVLAQYESESKSAEERSSGLEAKVMTSHVSRDACEVFLSSRSSVEEDVFRQLVVERINDGDITTALQLCCIGHQMLFDRNITDAISSSSDPQTHLVTFEQRNYSALYTKERTTFLSICDEWYKVLEPHGLMHVDQKKLLQKWIDERQYANIKDSVVSLMIEKCSVAKKEEKKRRKEKAVQQRRIKEQEAKQRREKIQNKDLIYCRQNSYLLRNGRLCRSTDDQTQGKKEEAMQQRKNNREFEKEANKERDRQDGENKNTK